MLQIKTDREKQLTFELDISGTANIPEIRLVMETSNKSDGMKLIFPGVFEGSTAVIRIPELTPILDVFEEKTVRVFLETIVDGHHNVIWEETGVSLEIPVKITTKSPKLDEAPAKETITVKSVTEKDKGKNDDKSDPGLFRNKKKDKQTEGVRQKTSLKSMLLNEDK